MTISTEESLRRLLTKLGTKTRDQLASTLAQAGDVTGVAVSGYLPLVGGTLTGPLIGTTATFSGDIATSGQISNANARLYTNGDILGAVITGNSIVSSTTIVATGAITAGNISATPAVSTIPKTGAGSTTLDIGWLPTSTLSVSTAVPLANDPRLSDSRPPSGTASGDLSGSYPAPTVAKLRGTPISMVAPTTGYILQYDGMSGTATWVDAATLTALSAYVLKAGDTMTGALAGTDATFSGDVTVGNKLYGANVILSGSISLYDGAYTSTYTVGATNAQWSFADATGVIATSSAVTITGTLTAPLAGLTGTISDAQHGNRAGGTLHAAATASTAGFVTLAISGGVVSGTVVQATDSRLSDARTPVTHNQAWSTITATPTTLAGYGITTPIASSDGGTGINNGGRTLTINTNSGTVAFGSAASTLTIGATTTISGGGTIAAGGFTFTVPATGTAAVLGTAQTFTATQTINAAVAISASGIGGDGPTVTPRLYVGDPTNSAKWVGVGYDATIDGGFIYAVQHGVAWKHLYLAAYGGAVVVGKASTTRSSGDLDVSGTVYAANIPAGTLAVLGTAQTFTAQQTYAITDAATTGLSTAMNVSHNSSGTPAATFGVRFGFQAKSSTTNNQPIGAADGVWRVATDASRTGALQFSVFWYGGVQEGFRIDADPGGVRLGFYGVTAVARPTAYTQTYATATRTHATPTATSVATTAATNTTPYGYSTSAQADAIVTALNALIVDVANIKQVLNSVIDDQQAVGLLA